MSKYTEECVGALAAVLDATKPLDCESPPSFFTEVGSQDLKRVSEAAFKLSGAVLDGRARAGALLRQLDG